MDKDAPRPRGPNTPGRPALHRSELEGAHAGRGVVRTREGRPGNAPGRVTNAELSRAIFGADSKLSGAALAEARSSLEAQGKRLLMLYDKMLRRVDCVFTHFNNEEYMRETITPLHEDDLLKPLPEPCECGLQHPSPFTWTRQFAPSEEIVQTSFKIAHEVASHEDQ